MKQFLFCEQDEGGMSHYVVKIREGEELAHAWPISGWMGTQNEYEDCRLSFFARCAQVGDFHEHRMGVAVRIQDE